MKRLVLAGLAAAGLIASGFAAVSPVGLPGVAQAVEPASRLITQVIRVEGVDCAACTITIRRQLKKLAGVRDVKPNQSDKSQIIVTFDPTRVTPDQLVATVNELGFKASLASAKGA